MSFQEKSLWLMFVSLAGAFVYYFVKVLPAAGPDVQPDQVVLFVVAVVLAVVMAIGRGDRARGPADVDGRRDRLIQLKGTRNAAWVLATGVFLALCAALLTEGNFVFTHVLLGAWVVAQLVEIGSQLVMYRRAV
jgi:hypothetical protein